MRDRKVGIKDPENIDALSENFETIEHTYWDVSAVPTECTHMLAAL